MGNCERAVVLAPTTNPTPNNPSYPIIEHRRHSFRSTEPFTPVKSTSPRFVEHLTLFHHAEYLDVDTTTTILHAQTPKHLRLASVTTLRVFLDRQVNYVTVLASYHKHIRQPHRKRRVFMNTGLWDGAILSTNTAVNTSAGIRRWIVQGKHEERAHS